MCESIRINPTQAKLIIMALQLLESDMETDLHGWEVGENPAEFEIFATTCTMIAETIALKQTLNDVFA